MSVAITLVTYNPTFKTYERLFNVSNLGFDIFVYDNTDLVIKEFLKPDGVHLISQGKNIGLSRAMNVVFKMAFDHGNDWAIFFDQDTVFNKETINHIENFIKSNDARLKKYFCIQFSDDLGHVSDSYNIDDRPIIINSGTAFNLKRLKNIGWMNEKYFVDLIDYEVCFRAKLMGWKIGKVANTPGLNHKIEQDDSVYKFFGKEITGRAYSRLRVFDYINNSKRLLWVSLKSFDAVFFFIILKNLIAYILSQIMFRFFRSLNKIK